MSTSDIEFLIGSTQKVGASISDIIYLPLFVSPPVFVLFFMCLCLNLCTLTLSLSYPAMVAWR